MTIYHIPGATPAFVAEGEPFHTAGIQYPGNWLTLASAEERAAIGAAAAPRLDAETQVLERDDSAGWSLREKAAEERAAALTRAQRDTLADIDAQAEMARARLLTPASGQTAAYAEKEREARDLIGGGSGPWPFLGAEALATGIAIDALAAAVVVNADRWRAIAAQIEATRRAAKVKVRVADSAAALAAAIAGLRWPD